MTPAERSLAARVAASARWKREPDRTKATAAARRALQERFEREVDPNGELSPEERQKRAASARSEHYARMALAKSRKQRRVA